MPGKKGIRSKAQQGYMFANHPETAKKMMHEAKMAGVDTRKLPRHVRKKKG
jgi:hypothetical protein